MEDCGRYGGGGILPGLLPYMELNTLPLGASTRSRRGADRDILSETALCACAAGDDQPF